jgi:hypothetical protein
MHKQLESHGMTRYQFIKKVTEAGVCTTHTAECLLADSDTVTGKRTPSFPLAIEMARLAGFQLTMTPSRKP